MKQRGFSLIELMVALVIGLIIALASMQILINSEAKKRSQAAVNATDQVSNFAAVQLEKYIRNAGSGFAQAYTTAYGCTLFAANGGTRVLPLAAALPAPFENVLTKLGGPVRVAPIVIMSQAEGVNDDLLVEAGAGGYFESITPFSGTPASGLLNLSWTVGYQPGDLVLVVNNIAPFTASADPTPCILEQVASGYAPNVTSAQQVSLSGNWYNATIAGPGTTGTVTLSSMQPSGYVMQMGNVGNTSATPAIPANFPSFQLLGVQNSGSDNELVSLDLLTGGTTPVPVADQVLEMHALYEVDAASNGALSWQTPASGTYLASNLMTGTEASAALLATIKAVRIGLILRTDLSEQASSSTSPSTLASLTLFSDTGFPYTRTFSATEQTYRYRAVELTIPLRNALIATK